MLEQSLTAIEEIMLTPGLPLKIGVMMALALVMGYWLYEDSRDFFKWFLTGIVYIGFQEWFRAAITDVTTHDTYLAFIASVIFGITVYGGARLARYVHHKEFSVTGGIDTQGIKKIIEDVENNNKQGD